MAIGKVSTGIEIVSGDIAVAGHARKMFSVVLAWPLCDCLSPIKANKPPEQTISGYHVRRRKQNDAGLWVETWARGNADKQPDAWAIELQKLELGVPYDVEIHPTSMTGDPKPPTALVVSAQGDLSTEYDATATCFRLRGQDLLDMVRPNPMMIRSKALRSKGGFGSKDLQFALQASRVTANAEAHLHQMVGNQDNMTSRLEQQVDLSAGEMQMDFGIDDAGGVLDPFYIVFSPQKRDLLKIASTKEFGIGIDKALAPYWVFQIGGGRNWGDNSVDPTSYWAGPYKAPSPKTNYDSNIYRVNSDSTVTRLADNLDWHGQFGEAPGVMGQFPNVRGLKRIVLRRDWGEKWVADLYADVDLDGQLELRYAGIPLGVLPDKIWVYLHSSTYALAKHIGDELNQGYYADGRGPYKHPSDRIWHIDGDMAIRCAGGLLSSANLPPDMADMDNLPDIDKMPDMAVLKSAVIPDVKITKHDDGSLRLYAGVYRAVKECGDVVPLLDVSLFVNNERTEHLMLNGLPEWVDSHPALPVGSRVRLEARTVSGSMGFSEITI